MELLHSGSLNRVTRVTALRHIPGSRRASLAAAVVAVVAFTVLAGCKQQAKQPAAPTDQQLSNAIQSKIQGDQALAGENIQVSVANGVATLSGTVPDAASRALAGDDGGAVLGVRTVVNNLTVQPPQQAAAAPPPPARTREEKRNHERHLHSEMAQTNQQANLPPPSDQGNLAPVPPPVQSAPPAPVRAAAPPPPPPVPPKPVIRRVTIPSGTVIPVILTETLNSKSTDTNDAFHASLASDLMSHGLVAIPRGAPVLGQVLEAKKAGHFKGEALLSIDLTQVTVHGRKVGLMTDTYTKNGGSGRGKNTAEKSGGGALFGALVGALAGGGKGAAIGALAGGGAGAGVNAITRGKEAEIPSETRLEFRLQAPIVITIPPPGTSESNQDDEPHLIQPH